MIYSKDNFLKSGIDLARHSFDAFKIDNEIHIVYDMGTDKQIVCIQSIDFILANYDEFLWTPFAEFV